MVCLVQFMFSVTSLCSGSLKPEPDIPDLFRTSVTWGQHLVPKLCTAPAVGLKGMTWVKSYDHHDHLAFTKQKYMCKIVLLTAFSARLKLCRKILRKTSARQCWPWKSEISHRGAHLMNGQFFWPCHVCCGSIWLHVHLKGPGVGAYFVDRPQWGGPSGSETHMWNRVKNV